MTENPVSLCPPDRKFLSGGLAPAKDVKQRCIFSSHIEQSPLGFFKAVNQPYAPAGCCRYRVISWLAISGLSWFRPCPTPSMILYSNCPSFMIFISSTLADLILPPKRKHTLPRMAMPAFGSYFSSLCGNIADWLWLPITRTIVSFCIVGAIPEKRLCGIMGAKKFFVSGYCKPYF